MPPAPDAFAPSAPLTAVSELLDPPDDGFTLARSDHGAFRAVEPGSDAPLQLRPTWAGLRIERPGMVELVPWNAVRAITLTRTQAGRARIPSARIALARGPSLDVADGLAPGADQLPFACEAGGPLLIRTERFRLLVATVIACSGLAPSDPGQFLRRPRLAPPPQLAVRKRQLPGWAPPFLVVASVAALVYYLGMALITAIGITVVLLVHEYGHAIAMRLFGLRVRGVLLLPFLGGATIPEHAYASRWDEARVALAGPLTGIPVALAGLVTLHFGWLPADHVHPFVFWALLLNLLNLIPILPLDGGHVLCALTDRLPRPARGIVTVAPVTLLIVVLVVRFPNYMGALAALFLAFALLMTQVALRRHRPQEWMHGLGVDLRRVREALRDITYTFTGVAREDVDDGVAPVQLTGWQAGAVMAVYAGVVAALATTWVLVHPVMQELSFLPALR